MKIIIYLIATTSFFTLHAQTIAVVESNDTLEMAIKEFYKPFEEQDFTKPIALLKSLKNKNPERTEVRYFLGYSYDRLNAKDGTSIPNIDLPTTRLASEEFEFIIKKEPKYQGRKIALDPYSKITAVWGSLALKYYYEGKIDSMKYALHEGKKRGGFNDAVLGFGKSTLSACADSSILFTSGDNYSFPILYVQQIENFRTDIQAIDVSLLNTNWYCTLLKNIASKSFLKDSIPYHDFPVYAISNKQSISIVPANCQEEKFIWEINELRNGQYILKGDSILKEIIIKNKFKDDIYFTIGQLKGDLLSLDNYFSDGIYTNRIKACKDDANQEVEIQTNIDKLDLASNDLNQNSDDVLFMINGFRFAYVRIMNDAYENENYELVRTLLKDMEDRFPSHYAPIEDKTLKYYINKFKVGINH
ncbi:MAG: hypothetical protein AB8G15_19670 [Saprospiraceae bacterium]